MPSGVGALAPPFASKRALARRPCARAHALRCAGLGFVVNTLTGATPLGAGRTVYCTETGQGRGALTRVYSLAGTGGCTRRSGCARQQRTRAKAKQRAAAARRARRSDERCSTGACLYACCKWLRAMCCAVATRHTGRRGHGLPNAAEASVAFRLL